VKVTGRGKWGLTRPFLCALIFWCFLGYEFFDIGGEQPFSCKKPGKLGLKGYFAPKIDENGLSGLAV